MERHPRRLPVVADFLAGKEPDVSDEPRVSHAGQDVVLEVSGLEKSFRLRDGLFHWREVPAVEDVSFTLRRGQTLGVAGESGSGKTTMGLTLMRLHQATAGRVILHGTGGAVDLLGLSEGAMMPYRQRIQIVFQNPYASLNPRFTIGPHTDRTDDAARHRRGHTGTLGSGRRAAAACRPAARFPGPLSA